MHMTNYLRRARVANKTAALTPRGEREATCQPQQTWKPIRIQMQVRIQA
jgi:hypothetical protein